MPSVAFAVTMLCLTPGSARAQTGSCLSDDALPAAIEAALGPAYVDHDDMCSRSHEVRARRDLDGDGCAEVFVLTRDGCGNAESPTATAFDVSSGRALPIMDEAECYWDVASNPPRGASVDVAFECSVQDHQPGDSRARSSRMLISCFQPTAAGRLELVHRSSEPTRDDAAPGEYCADLFDGAYHATASDMPAVDFFDGDYDEAGTSAEIAPMACAAFCDIAADSGCRIAGMRLCEWGLGEDPNTALLYSCGALAGQLCEEAVNAFDCPGLCLQGYAAVRELFDR